MKTGSALADMLSVLRRNRSGDVVGVYSVCSAHPLVLETAMTQARHDQVPALVEATANQVNQFGGYTGLHPGDFPAYVAAIADRAGLAPDRVVLGGDHLGPVCWTDEAANAYTELLRGHFAILKVGPQLTFVLREALFALSAIEHELLDSSDKGSWLPEVCDRVMTDHPGQWIRHYPAKGPRARWYRRYSYSDRIRYYWSHPRVSSAVERLFENLSETGIPTPVLSQFLPAQATAVREGNLVPKPRDLAIHRIMQVTNVYSAACRGTA